MMATERTFVDKPTQIRSQFFVLLLLVVFTPPAIASLCVLLIFILCGVRTLVQKHIFWALVSLFLTFVGAIITTTLFSSNGREILEGSKFLLMGLAFWAGFSSYISHSQLRKLAAALTTAILIWYIISILGGVEIPFLYPPDFNNSVILLLFLAFFLAEGRGIVFRLGIVAVLIFFSEIAQSRIILLFAPAFFVSQPVSMSPLRIMGLLIATGIGLYFMVTAGQFGSFSDLVRIEIYRASYAVIADANFQLFANGPGHFVSALNGKLPPFVTAHLEVLHAHNAFLDIFGSYGALSALSFFGFLCAILRFSIVTGDGTLRNQTILLFLLMLIEAVVSDSRIMFGVLLFLGVQTNIAAAKRSQNMS